MYTMTSKLVLSELFFVVTVASGVVVSNGGRPFNPLTFGTHKIIALATIVLMAIAVNQLRKIGGTMPPLAFAMMVSTGVLFLSLIITGSLLSVNIRIPDLVLRIHQVAPLLVLISASATVYALALRTA
jgi:hypothetical protein